MARLVPPVVEAGTLAANEQPTIVVDDELTLRRFEPADVPVVLAAFADPDIRSWNLRSVEGADEAREWVLATHDGWADETAATWAVCSADGTVLGRVTLYPRPAEGQGELTYWVLPAARGSGVAARAVAALAGWAHGRGLRRLEIRHSVENPGSCRVAERAGFAAEGTLRRALLHADGRWHDMHLHAHLVVEDDLGGDPPCWEGLVEDHRDIP
jgi:ribosomal-protein-alanine N-acetyltransferase